MFLAEGYRCAFRFILVKQVFQLPWELLIQTKGPENCQLKIFISCTKLSDFRIV